MKKNEVAKVEVMDENTIAASLTQQYEAATGALKVGVQAALKFGAMLIKAEEIVFANQEGKKHIGTSQDGYGLQSWLAKNCPTINYKTAMRWKGIAANAAMSLGCDQANAVKLLTGETSGLSAELPKDELAERVEELYAAPSLRKLSQMCFNFAAEDAGRPKAEMKQLPKLKKSDEAKAIWNGVLQVIQKSSVRDSIPMLGENETRIAYETLGDLRKLLKDHLGEF